MSACIPPCPPSPANIAQIYVREVVQAGVALRGPAPDRVALFVHGAGTPAEVAFDVPYQDYSWMAYLAHAGFDAFSMDMTGYGRSTRPTPMNDPCNLSREQQAGFIPALIPSPCSAQLSASADHHRIGLERSGRRDRLSAVPAARREGEPGGVVAGRAARRGLHGAASGTNQPVGAAGARVQPSGPCRSARAVAGRWNHHDHAIPRRIQCQLGAANRMPRSSGPSRERFGLGTDDWLPIPSAQHGEPASGAPRK